MLSGLGLIVLVILLIWLGTLSYFFWKLTRNYDDLTHDIDAATLPSILDHFQKQLSTFKKTTSELSHRCDTIEKDSLFHIQKIGLLRFNPFKDTGGDQSFILALLDANDTGVVISGLYSRSGTRWYAKKIVDGKGFEHELSEEEKKALSIASPLSKKLK